MSMCMIRHRQTILYYNHVNMHVVNSLVVVMDTGNTIAFLYYVL